MRFETTTIFDMAGGDHPPPWCSLSRSETSTAPKVAGILLVRQR
jgi:hypothetical protein